MLESETKQWQPPKVKEADVPLSQKYLSPSNLLDESMQSHGMEFVQAARLNRSELPDPDSDLYLGARETYKHDVSPMSLYDSASVQTPQDPRMYPGVKRNSPN